MAEFDGGVREPESPAGQEPAPGPDPSLSGQQDQGSQDPTAQQHVPYARFKEVNDRYRDTAARLQDLEGRVQQWVQQQAAQAQNQGRRVPTLSEQEHQAGDAMWRIIQHHPELRRVVQMMQAFPQLAQGYGTAREVAQSQRDALVNQGLGQIKQFAGEAGLPTSDRMLRTYDLAVADTIAAMPQGRERIRRGDLSVVREAWDVIKPELGGLRAPQQALAASQRGRVSRLPPAPRGAPAGPAGPPKLDPSDPQKVREWENRLHAGAHERLSQLMNAP